MTEAEVFAVLKKHIMEQLEDEVEESDIDIEKSMLDLGANSLDIVEIVTNTMRELKIKIPRDELASIDTMKGLVSAMAEHTNR
jgi:polyketide biosynthesis acyl carrier protein